MTDPITAAMVATLALSKFTEGAASETAKKLVNSLWCAIAHRFKGRKKAEEAIAQLEASKGQATEAKENLVKVLGSEMFEDDDFRAKLEKLVQELNQQEPQAVQEVLVGVKGRNIKVKDVTVESTSGKAAQQRVASDLEASEDIDLGNISVK